MNIFKHTKLIQLRMPKINNDHKRRIHFNIKQLGETISQLAFECNPEFDIEFVSSELTDLRKNKEIKNGIRQLSSREHKVACLLAENSGLTSQEISQLLSISKHSISTYRSRIIKKLSLKSTRELAEYKEFLKCQKNN